MYSRSNLHRKTVRTVAAQRAKGHRMMHAPLVTSTIPVRGGIDRKLRTFSTYRAEKTAVHARRSGRVPGLVKAEHGAPDEWRRRRNVTTATAARLDRIVDELVVSFHASTGRVAVSTLVSFGTAPETYDTLICAYLLDALSEASIPGGCHVEIEREGPVLGVRVSLDLAGMIMPDSPVRD